MWTSGNHHEPCGAYNKRAASARPPAPDQDPLYPPDPCLKGVLPSQVRETREDPGNNENTTHETRELRENRMGRPGARVVLLTVSFFRLVRVFRGLFSPLVLCGLAPLREISFPCWFTKKHVSRQGAKSRRKTSLRNARAEGIHSPIRPSPSRFLFLEQDPGNNENTTHETRELRENRMGRPGARVVLPTVSFFRLVRVFRGLFFLFPVLAAVMPLQKFRGRIRHFNCDGTPDSWEFLWCVPSAPKNPCPVGGVSLSLWRWRLFPDREIRGKEQAAPCLHPPFAPLLFCAIRPRRRIGRS